ncbi:hypothetical protein AB9P05_07440 [Roseivirga sp. BDSF3-8]|uniref:hypothetical protein n=1 Tax=Roseivirga sp. BDSF3-8 TaxID=3241598 RepID=UPI0035318372
MGPATHIFSSFFGSELIRNLLSIVSGHHDRLTDLEGLIGNRLDDQFDSEDPDRQGREGNEELAGDEGI